jgi:integrase
MSVRRRTWMDSVGVRHEAWLVDVQVVDRSGHVRRVQRVAPLNNRRAAEKFEHELREQLLNCGDKERPAIAQVVPTFAQFADRFMATYAVTNNKASEVDAKTGILRVHLLPAFGASALDRIGVAEVEEYKAHKIESKMARKSINNQLTVLRKILATAVEWRVIASVPRIKWLKTPAPEFDFLTFEEASRLIAAAATDWRAAITIALRTGLRLGELRALRWSDVDLEGGRLVARRAVWRNIVSTPKNGRVREVPLSHQAAEALREHPRLGETVFCAPDGSMLSKGAMKWPLWNACRQAGLRNVGWHIARHTFASHLVMRGAPLKAVQELLGHSTIEMTMRYAHLSPDARRDAVRLLDVKEAVTLRWTTSKGTVLCIPLGSRRMARGVISPLRGARPRRFVPEHHGFWPTSIASTSSSSGAS